MGLKAKFFKIKPEYYVDGKAIITSTTIDMALDALDAHICHTFDDGDLLVHCLLKRHNLNAMEENTDVDAESMAGVAELGLGDVYKGMDYGSEPYVGLFWFHPELDGTKAIDDGEGGTIDVPIIQEHTWGAMKPT